MTQVGNCARMSESTAELSKEQGWFVIVKVRGDTTKNEQCIKSRLGAGDIVREHVKRL